MKKLQINVPLKEAFAGMTFKQKVVHLWTYYNWVVVAAIFVLMFASLLYTVYLSARMDYLFSGYLANVGITEDGTAYLTDDWCEILEGNGKTEVVTLGTVSFRELTSSENLADDYAAAMKITLQISTQKLDYAIIDQVAMDYYINQKVFASLEDVLTPQQLDAQKDNILYHQAEDGEYPLALDISGTDFAKNCLVAKGPIYLCFPGNTEHTETCVSFLDYLLNWKA